MTPQPPPDPFAPLIAQFFADLRAQRERLAAADWTPTPPEDPPDLDTFRLKPLRASALPALPPPVEMDTVRSEIARRVYEHATGAASGVLLMAAPQGSGKSHAAVEVIQRLARAGFRIAWFGQRHESFNDLAAFPHFDPALWAHWKGRAQPVSEQRKDETMCRYAGAMEKWTARGLPTWALCSALCGPDGWSKRCDYMLQKHSTHPLTFCVHDNIMAFPNLPSFDLAIVDEDPVGKVTSGKRTIPADKLHCGESGLLRQIVDRLEMRAANCAQRHCVSGAALFGDTGDANSLGNLLLQALDDDYLARLELGIDAPAVPRVYRPDQVDSAPYFYLYDLLLLAEPELRAWREGWPAWNERVRLARSGLALLKAATVSDKMPRKIVVLDATADAHLLSLFFRQPIADEYRPHVRRYGRVVQVAGRANGKRATSRRDADGDTELTNAGRQVVEVARRLTDGRGKTAVICWKNIASEFNAVFGHENVIWYGRETGTNTFESYNNLVLVGSPDPGDANLRDLAAALTGEIRPFWQWSDEPNRDGEYYHRPIAAYRDEEIRLSLDGLADLRARWNTEFSARVLSTAGVTAAEQIAGVSRRTRFYPNEVLSRVHQQAREQKLVQAMHRLRLNVPDAALRRATVYLLTGTPTGVEVDEVYNDPPVGPAGIPWQTWLRLEPWLAQQHYEGNRVTYATLCEAIRVSQAHASGWLEAIVAFQPHRWHIAAIEPDGRGRPAAYIESVQPRLM